LIPESPVYMEVQPVSPKTIVKVNRVNIDKFVFIRYSLFKVKGKI
jgi:hypothetical protein